MSTAMYFMLSNMSCVSLFGLFSQCPLKLAKIQKQTENITESLNSFSIRFTKIQVMVDITIREDQKKMQKECPLTSYSLCRGGRI